MKSIRFRLLIAATAVLLGTALGHSQAADATTPPPMHGHGHEFAGGDHMLEFFAKHLDLTADQQTQAKAILQKEHPVMKPLFQQSHQIEQQLHQYAEGTYDEAKVRALAAQQAQVQVELTVQKTRIHNELFQILTPEQQTKAKEMEASHEARMQKHMHQAAAPAAPEQQ
jgi:Spy/CpxP family protein refolding chaperone